MEAPAHEAFLGLCRVFEHYSRHTVDGDSASTFSLNMPSAATMAVLTGSMRALYRGGHEVERIERSRGEIIRYRGLVACSFPQAQNDSESGSLTWTTRE